jgi:hypothetical protein
MWTRQTFGVSTLRYTLREGPAVFSLQLVGTWDALLERVFNQPVWEDIMMATQGGGSF